VTPAAITTDPDVAVPQTAGDATELQFVSVLNDRAV